MTTIKKIAILGSTGSIGTQTLEVVDHHPDKFSVEVITANNSAKELIAQAIKYKPNCVVIANEEKYKEVDDALFSHDIKVYAGSDALEQVVQMDSIDIVVTAMVGYAGLIPTIRAIEANKPIALANKETLVVAGDLINEKVKQHQVAILPVDSEHSAIFQCLTGEHLNPIEQIYLTCSGGPFLGKTRDELKHVTAKDALKHPNWDMGAKISIDSATMMNKGFEVIEAKWLFDLTPDQIKVIVHPQSIVHSLVQFEDGSMKAQMGLPDMKLPIQYALTYPERYKTSFERFNFMDYPNLTFSAPDMETFSNLRLAYQAMDEGGNKACALNAANEIVVKAFLNNEISFLGMPKVNELVMEKISYIAKPTLDDYIETDKVAREMAIELIKKRTI
ncbi:1-deoxy-D-xylulose-5-phosphate reductoisomerase [Halosquirtibacter xylanolyticus]|uniref:1-deoxy-D-xylulose-5-phosphate reductoisomerase n=1 Tax=Halosquirtibacter xylanolyticus TaxID=3374599 RepID=UPI0037486449|nr:1-deoxy-D-xylulose-5-phosphate reductoisomerase [Prolixibacteraceae bacterium]